jgi:hypothetical protein
MMEYLMKTSMSLVSKFCFIASVCIVASSFLPQAQAVIRTVPEDKAIEFLGGSPEGDILLFRSSIGGWHRYSTHRNESHWVNDTVGRGYNARRTVAIRFGRNGTLYITDNPFFKKDNSKINMAYPLARISDSDGVG